MVVRELNLPEGEIADLCRRYHICRLALFGSAVRGDGDEASDIDVLVEFEPAHVPGLAFFRIERELSAVLGRRVDLNTRGFLCDHIRDEVLREAEDIYAAP